MKICRICGKPLSFFDSVTGIAEHDECTASEEDRARELARQNELAKAKAEEEERNRELMAQRRANGLSRIIGQEEVVQRLRKFAALYTNGRPGHVLLTGPDGMGKRTLARAFANEYCAREIDIEARSLTSMREVSAMLWRIPGRNDPPTALIIGHIEQTPRPAVGNIVSYLRDFRAAIIGVDSEGSSKILENCILPQSTCMGTAYSDSKCLSEVLEVFSLILPLSGYSNEELIEICQRLAGQNKISFTHTAADLIARTSDGSPHQVELVVKRLAGLGKSAMEKGDVAEALSAFGLCSEAVPPTAGLANFEALSGVDFEKLITSLLHQMGFEALMTKASGDGGIDIVATLDQPLVGGRYLVQCKRFAAGNLVGAATVREFYGAVTADGRAVKGILITTSDFTTQAKDFARRLPIELIGCAQLNRLLSEHNLPTGGAASFRLFS